MIVIRGDNGSQTTQRKIMALNPAERLDNTLQALQNIPLLNVTHSKLDTFVGEIDVSSNSVLPACLNTALLQR